MRVEARQRLAWRVHRLQPWRAGKETLELRLAAEHDGSAALGDQRRVAHALERVAETLLGVQEDGAAREVLAVPQRLGNLGCGELRAVTRQRQSNSRQPSAYSPQISSSKARAKCASGSWGSAAIARSNEAIASRCRPSSR